MCPSTRPYADVRLDPSRSRPAPLLLTPSGLQLAQVARVRCAIAARNELPSGLDLVIVARTDCLLAEEHGGLDEAIKRCKAFAALGADVVYAERLDLEQLSQLRAELDTQWPQTYMMLAQVELEGRPVTPRYTP